MRQQLPASRDCAGSGAGGGIQCPGPEALPCELALAGFGVNSGALDILAVWWHVGCGPGLFLFSDPGFASVPTIL